MGVFSSLKSKVKPLVVVAIAKMWFNRELVSSRSPNVKSTFFAHRKVVNQFQLLFCFISIPRIWQKQWYIKTAVLTKIFLQKKTAWPNKISGVYLELSSIQKAGTMWSPIVSHYGRSVGKNTNSQIPYQATMEGPDPFYPP